MNGPKHKVLQKMLILQEAIWPIFENYESVVKFPLCEGDSTTIFIGREKYSPAWASMFIVL